MENESLSWYFVSSLRARFRALFQVLRREKQIDYMFNTTPDALAFRKATNAKPSFWIGLGDRLAPHNCSSCHVALEELSQAEPVPVQPQTVLMR